MNVNNTVPESKADASARKNSQGGLDIEVLVRELDSRQASLVAQGESKFATAMDKTRMLSSAPALYNKG